ncbi:DUF6146 family protein [Lutibacter holmesii]|uniref:DUF6146 family protein n=1 Tax=Lutibacter holmesii TaxID=1137985 RepID=A0ABW3WNY0_9FLAO
MKNLLKCFVLIFFIISCGSTSKTTVKNKKNTSEEAVRIANDSLEYEIIIFDIGFNTYLNTIAQPQGYYSLQYLENKNKFYVSKWNIRVQNPYKYNPKIYENIIDYDFSTDYGLEVNYKLFNYFKFVEYKYKEVF